MRIARASLRCTVRWDGTSAQWPMGNIGENKNWINARMIE